MQSNQPKSIDHQFIITKKCLLITLIGIYYLYLLITYSAQVFCCFQVILAMYGNRLSMFINTLLSNLNPENGDPLLQATFELLLYKAKHYDPRFYTVTPSVFIHQSLSTVSIDFQLLLAMFYECKCKYHTPCVSSVCLSRVLTGKTF